MKPIRMVAVDMDGTLLDSSQQIPKENAQALIEAARAGIAVVICSGRMVEDVSRFARESDIPCMIASGNGARLLDAPLPGGRIIARHDMPTDGTIQHVLDVLLEEGLIVNGFRDGEVYTVRPAGAPQWQHHLAKRKLARIFYGEEPMRRAAQAGLIKIVAVQMKADGSLARARERLRDVAGIETTSSWTDNIEIMPAGVDKGSALRELGAYLGIAPEEIMAIGDQENDRPMLQLAGHSTAMGNATNEIKALCRHQTRTNDEAGVAWAVRRWALGEERA